MKTRQSADNTVIVQDGPTEVAGPIDVRIIISPATNSLKDVTMLTLRNPRTDCATLYGFDKTGQRVFEVLRFEDNYRSWFINDFVVEDGSFLLLTPIHSIFLALPYIMKGATERFVPLKDLLNDECFPETKRLLNCSQLLTALPQLCDVKEIGGSLNVFRLNGEKLCSWLKARMDRLLTELDRKNELPSGIIGDQKAIEKYSFGIVADYLPASAETLLRAFLGISSDAILNNKVESENTTVKTTTELECSEPHSKKSRCVEDPLEDYSIGNPLPSQIKAAKPLTQAQKKLQKASVGSKSLTGFFKKMDK